MLSKFVDTQIASGVATITLNRPASGNALNWPLLEQFRAALRLAAASPEVHGIVIAAAGKTFVSGADVSFFTRCLETGNMGKIVDCIRASQEAFAEIAECSKPVVAAVQGAALGGGVELALACHYLVASGRASFSLPETALGIVPLSGGTYRVPLRIGVPLTKWLVYTGRLLPPHTALSLGLIDECVAHEELLFRAQRAASKMSVPSGRAGPRLDQPTAEVASLQSWFAQASVDRLMAQPQPEGRVLATAWKAMRSRPLPALQCAEKLLDRALGQTTVQGAREALAVVPALFGSPEVLRRLADVARRQRGIPGA
jgi:enoyl-CoA hydratase/carnithine racemase